MKGMLLRFFWPSLSVLLLLSRGFCGVGREESRSLTLSDGWRLQSSTKVAAGGEAISAPGFQPDGWSPVDVPATVLAALVKDGVYPDPDFGINLRRIPGAEYSRPIVEGVVSPTNLSDL